MHQRPNATGKKTPITVPTHSCGFGWLVSSKYLREVWGIDFGSTSRRLFVSTDIAMVSVPGDLRSAIADRNKDEFTLSEPAPHSDDVIDQLTVLLYRFKPRQALLIGPLRDLAASVHSTLKLLQQTEGFCIGSYLRFGVPTALTIVVHFSCSMSPELAPGIWRVIKLAERPNQHGAFSSPTIKLLSVNSGVMVCDDTSTIEADSSANRQGHFRRYRVFPTAKNDGSMKSRPRY